MQSPTEQNESTQEARDELVEQSIVQVETPEAPKVSFDTFAISPRL